MRLVLIDGEPLFGVGLARALALSDPAGQVWVHARVDAWWQQHSEAPGPVDAVIADAQTLGAQLPAALRDIGQRLPQAARVVAVRDAADLPAELPAELRAAVGTVHRGLSPEGFVRAIWDVVARRGGQPRRAAALGGRSPGITSRITSRQRDVLALVTRGESNKRIACELRIAERTVKLHVTALLGQLGARNRTQLLIKALELGLAAGPSSP